MCVWVCGWEGGAAGEGAPEPQITLTQEGKKQLAKQPKLPKQGAVAKKGAGAKEDKKKPEKKAEEAKKAAGGGKGRPLDEEDKPLAQRRSVRQKPGNQ